MAYKAWRGPAGSLAGLVGYVGGTARVTAEHGITATMPAFIDASALSFPDAPRTISAGGTYTGLRISAGDGVACVDIDTADTVIFQDCDFRFTNGNVGSGGGVYAPGGMVGGYTPYPKLEFYNCRFFGEFPDVLDAHPGYAIHYNEGKRLIVENCHFQRGRIYAYTHSADAADVLRVRYNTAVNLDGRRVDANGDPTGTNRRIMQFFQHSGTTGIAGDFEIAWNEIWNVPGESAMEDAINLFATGGTASNPVLVHHNLVNGAYPPVLAGAGYSGGGIMLSDGDGDYSYGVAEYNVVLASSNYGMSITGGDHFTLRNNRVFRTGTLPDDTTVEVSGGGPGMYVYNYGDSLAFGDHVLQDNVIRWQDGVGGTNNLWVAEPGPNFTNTGNTAYATTIDQAFINAEVVTYRQAAVTAGVTIGATRS